MDKIEKILRRMSLKDRLKIAATKNLILGRKFDQLDIKKLQGYECIYRVRIGNYRIIYFDDGNEIILKAIKKRDESTYSNLL